MEQHHYAWLEAHTYRTVEWLADRLKDGFDIHHLDGNHDNNDPKNLVLIECSDHMMLHAGVRMCRLIGSVKMTERSRKTAATLGKYAYELRLEGMKWSDVANQLELYEAGNVNFPYSARAIALAKSYSKHHGKPWPIRL